MDEVGGNWVFRFDRTAWSGGFVKPLTTSADFPASRYEWMVAGGPLVTVASTLVLAWMWHEQGNGSWNWIGTLLWTSLIAAVLAILPFSMGLNRTDGALLWQLMRRPDRTRYWMAAVALHTEEAEGVRPRVTGTGSS